MVIHMMDGKVHEYDSKHTWETYAGGRVLGIIQNKGPYERVLVAGFSLANVAYFEP